MTNPMGRIHLCLAHLSGREKEFVNEAFDSDWIAPLGPNVDGFESDLEQYFGDGHRVVALNSGTAAIHLALVHCGVVAGDEVLCQSFTFCASANPITYLGAVPVFVDSEPDTWNISPQLLEEAIEDRIAKTGRVPKAIIVVHLYGMPAKMAEIVAIANKYGITLIEDAAEALGSSIDGQLCGTLGDYGILSFNGNKMITTGGGGALICATEQVKSEIIYYSTQAREPRPYYHHEHIGYNYRMSNVSAGIGRGQMFVLQSHIEHHRRIFELYRELLSDIEGIKLHESQSENFASNYWLNCIELSEDLHIKGQAESGEPSANVDALRIALDRVGIESRPLWKPLHLQPVFASCPNYVNGVSESLFRRGLCLPSGPRVSTQDAEFIINQIRGNIE